MDRKDIIRMAKEAGFHVGEDDYGDPMLETNSGDVIKFAQLVAAHEREECAKIADAAAARAYTWGRKADALDISSAIRART